MIRPTVVHVNLASGFAGGERQTLELMKEQKRQGVSVCAVSCSGGQLSREFQAIGISHIEAPNFFFGHFKIEKKLPRSAVVFHAQDGRSVYWCFLHLLLFRRPYIITRKIDIPIKRSLIARLAYQHACYLVGVSTRITEMLSAISGIKNIVRIPDFAVSYPVDSSFAYPPAQGKFVVVHAAKMIPHKAFHVTIEAARHLEKSHPNILFLLLGDGPLRKQLEKQAQGLSNLKFLGHQSNMGDWFNIAGVVILPSLTEGLGSVLLEAMVAGVPVIGSKTGGIPDAIENEKTGLLIEPSDAVGLSRAIARLQADENLRKSCIKAAQEKMRYFDIVQVVHSYSDLYQTVLRG